MPDIAPSGRARACGGPIRRKGRTRLPLGRTGIRCVLSQPWSAADTDFSGGSPSDREDRRPACHAERLFFVSNSFESERNPENETPQTLPHRPLRSPRRRAGDDARRHGVRGGRRIRRGVVRVRYRALPPPAADRDRPCPHHEGGLFLPLRRHHRRRPARDELLLRRNARHRHQRRHHHRRFG